MRFAAMLWFEIGQLTTDCVTYWFFWKHLMARWRGLEFGVFDRSDATKMGSSAWSYGPRRSIIFPPQNYHSQRASARPSSLSAPLHENTSQMWARPCGPRLSSMANAPGANFSPVDVCLAVSDMQRSTPTTPSVQSISWLINNKEVVCLFGQFHESRIKTDFSMQHSIFNT